MYDLNLKEGEEVVLIEEDVIVGENDQSKKTTIALTNQRLLFLEVPDSIDETLRVAKGVDYIKEKVVYYQICLDEIKNVVKDTIILDNNKEIIISSADILNKCMNIDK